jgi:flagellar basal body rod protein FlgG
MKFSKICKFGVVLAAVAGVAGLCACEWGAGRDATSWSDTFNWVNFSGTYRTSGVKTTTKENTTERGSATTTSTSTATALTGAPLTVIQQGQNLTITDGRNGSVYTGKISTMRSASGYENTQAVASGAQDGVKTGSSPHALPPGDDTIIASFEATGPGGRLVGTLQGRVFDTNTDFKGDIFGARTLTATLVGPKGTTQIEAECTANSSVNIFYSTGSNGTGRVDTDTGEE